MSIVGIYDESDERLLIFSDFNLFLVSEQKEHTRLEQQLTYQFGSNRQASMIRNAADLVLTFGTLVVEVTCLLSPLSAPSVSSPVDLPGEVLVFLRNLLDLH